MSKNTIILVCSICVLLGMYIFMYGRTVEAPITQCTQEAKICPDGSGVGRTGPNCEFAPCPTQTVASSTDTLIVTHTPQPNQEITSPISISGKARGNWFFEGSFPITIVNWDGLIIGQGIGTAQGDWMTTEFVPFTATISYTFATGTPYNRGAIILKKDNPSGLPKYDDSREIPIVFKEATLP